MIGALSKYISTPNEKFQPMNANFGIIPSLDEKIKDKNIVLVHAACPMNKKDECDLTIKQGDDIFNYVWAREDDPFMPFRCRIGHKDYFTIVGHTPNISDYGFEYHKNGNYLNIDGGCAQFARGMFANDHVPLVEIKNGYLKILTFNNSNEIIYGNYFDGENAIPLTEEELDKACNAVASHMGPWNTSNYSDVVLPVPKAPIEKFVHMCDYLASRRFINLDFDNNDCVIDESKL